MSKHYKQKNNHNVSKGIIGEEAAELWFNVIGWKMFRTQPETRTVFRNGKMTVIHSKAEGDQLGIVDYTGYRYVDASGMIPVYTACEVKTSKGDTAICSKLDPYQRAWMLNLPAISAFVAIYWEDHGVVKVYRFKEYGSYKFYEKTIGY